MGWLGGRFGRSIIFAHSVLFVAWIDPPRVVAIALLLIINLPLGYYLVWLRYRRN